jgi:hypothetical protein
MISLREPRRQGVKNITMNLGKERVFGLGAGTSAELLRTQKWSLGLNNIIENYLVTAVGRSLLLVVALYGWLLLCSVLHSERE